MYNKEKSMKKDNIVYLNFNDKKGIHVLNFYNPILKKRSTKSLGIEIGSDVEKAKLVQAQVSKIINNDEFHTYLGYKLAKEQFLEEAVKAVYDKTKLKKEEFNESIGNFWGNYIQVEDKENEKFIKDAVILIGDPGVGKTKIIQQKIGSVEYNTPASTVSNTTTGTFIADIDSSSNKLELLYQESDDVQQNNNIKENIYSLLRYLMLTKEKEIIDDEILNKLLISNDLRFNLTYLISDTKTLYEIAKQIHSDFKRICDMFKNNEEALVTIIEDIIIILDGNSSDECSYNFTDEQKEEINSLLVDNYIQQIQNLINKEKIKIIKELFKICKKSIENIQNARLIIRYIGNGEESVEIKYGEETSIDIVEKVIVNIKSLYISVQYDDKQPDDILKDAFYKIMQKVSCVDIKIKSILPLVEKIKIRGNFKSKVGKKQNSNDYLLIDSEGIGHNAGNLESSDYFIKNLQKVNKIVWMIDINRPVTQTTKDTLNLLSSNGSLYKTIISFTKCDCVLETNESIEQRIYKLKENLKKEFNGNVEIINSKIMDTSNMLLLGDMDKYIEKDKVFIKYRGKEIEDNINETFVNDFNQLENFKVFTIKEEIDLNYSLIYLAKIIDSNIQSFIKDFSNEVYSLHWKRVEAFTDRIGYNYNGRSFHTLRPEADLKKLLKTNIEYIISNPTNCSKKEKEQFYDYFQMIQEKIAKKIDEIIEKLIFKDNQQKWRDLYNLTGLGTGNSRKDSTVNLINESISFDRLKGKENEILKYIVFTIRDLNQEEFGKIKVNLNEFV